MGNGLVGQAKEMGGKVTEWQGEIFVKIPCKENPEKFWVVSFYFSSMRELIQILDTGKNKWFEPFTDVINLKVNGSALPELQQEDGPSCPYHGDKFIKDSKRAKGQQYCSAKLKDGSYCKWTSDAR